MVEVVRTAVGVGLLAGCAWFGYRAVTARVLSRSVSRADDDRPATLDEGETVVVEGTVEVGEPPPPSDALPVDEAGSVGAYVWRLTDRERLKHGDDSSRRITIDSGMEFGSFAVDDGRRAVRIDPEWLAETHGGSDVTAASPEWRASTPLSKLSWTSPYVHLENQRCATPVADVDEIRDGDGAGDRPDDESLEVKAVLDGETLAVSGEVTVEAGTPVLRGTGQTPMTLTDRGVDAFCDRLRRQSLKSGLVAVGLAALAALALATGLEVL